MADTSRSFIPLLARLAGGFRCIAYELPGRPGDGSRLWRYRHEDLASDLLALLDHLKLDRAYLYAASFGATVALRAMRAAPARLPRVILQAGTARRPLRRAEFWLSWLGRFLPGTVKRLPKREKILEAVHKSSFGDQPEEVWRSFVDWTASTPVATLAHQAQWLHRLDLRSELSQMPQPVLLIWGDRDRVMPPPHAETLRAGLPSAGLVIIEGAGHLPSYTHPDALAAVVHRFLTPPTNCPGVHGCAGAHDTTGKGHGHGESAACAPGEKSVNPSASVDV
jgi:pimeloyl-ACP methyl ester carboxylesterase